MPTSYVIHSNTRKASLEGENERKHRKNTNNECECNLVIGQTFLRPHPVSMFETVYVAERVSSVLVKNFF